MKLSQKIVYMRKKRNISQEQLAKKMNVSRQAVYKWEAGLNAPELEKVYSLAEIFNISYDLLLDEKINLETYFSGSESDATGEISQEENIEEVYEKPKESKRKGFVPLIVAISVVAFIIVAIVVGVIIANNLNSSNETSTDSKVDTNTNVNTDSDINSDTNTDTNTDTSTDTNADTNTDTGTDTSTDTSTGTSTDTTIPEKITITLSGDGNISVNETLSCEVGKPIGELPSPQLAGHILAGWFEKTDTEYKKPITESTIVTKEMTELVPVYVIDENNPPVIVKFDGNGGIISKKDKERFVVIGTRLGELPNVENEGYRLVGWYLSTDTYYFDEYTKGTIITGNVYDVITLKAIWQKAQVCIDGSYNHSWGTWRTIEEATCAKPRKDRHSCGECGLVETKYVKDTYKDHDFSIVELVQEGDCEKPTIYKYTCKICDLYKTEETAPSGHDYQNGVCSVCKENEFTEGVEYVISGGEAFVNGYNGSDEIVKISPTYTPENESTSYPVTSIKALKSEAIKELIVPEGVKSIGDAHGVGEIVCPNLEILRLPTTLETISMYAFADAPVSKVYIRSLKDWCEVEAPSAEIYADTSTYKIHSFYDLYLNDQLVTDLHISSDINYISTYIFANCRSIKALTMDNAPVRTISAGAFYSSGLQYAKISCSDIMGKAFYMCRDLVSVDIMNGPSSTYGDSFGCCYRLFEIYAPQSLKLKPGSTSYGEIAKHAKVVHTSSSEGSSVLKTEDGFFIGNANESYYLIMYVGDQAIIRLPRTLNGQSYTIGNFFILPQCGFENTVKKLYIPKEVTKIEMSGLYTSFTLEILCEAEKKPDGWNTGFGQNTEVSYSKTMGY